jgi:hypothetical protein
MNAATKRGRGSVYATKMLQQEEEGVDFHVDHDFVLYVGIHSYIRISRGVRMKGETKKKKEKRNPFKIII